MKDSQNPILIIACARSSSAARAAKVIRFCLFPSRSPEAYSLADISGWYVIRSKKRKTFFACNAAHFRAAAMPISSCESGWYVIRSKYELLFCCNDAQEAASMPVVQKMIDSDSAFHPCGKMFSIALLGSGKVPACMRNGGCLDLRTIRSAICK